MDSVGRLCFGVLVAVLCQAAVFTPLAVEAQPLPPPIVGPALPIVGPPLLPVPPLLLPPPPLVPVAVPRVARTPTPRADAGPRLSERERAAALAAALPEALHDHVAELRARVYLSSLFGERHFLRARVELLVSDGGWMVIYRGANATCPPGPRRGVSGLNCNYGPEPLPDVFACVERGSWHVTGYTYRVETLGDDDRCFGAEQPATRTLPSGTLPRRLNGRLFSADGTHLSSELLRAPGQPALPPDCRPLGDADRKRPPPLHVPEEAWAVYLAEWDECVWFGSAPFLRARPEVHPVAGGWAVVFHDAETSTGQGRGFLDCIGYCPTPLVTRVALVLIVCVDRDSWSAPGSATFGRREDDPAQHCSYLDPARRQQPAPSSGELGR
jgi:hypothetical protein